MDTGRPIRLLKKAAQLPVLSFNHIIPNVITLLSLCAGMTSIRLAFSGHYDAAVLAIVVAGLFDALDGRIARLLHGSSHFGAELDSLSDFVSFGVAPAFVMYFWGLHYLGSFGWIIALLYCICCGLRLARFNTMLEKSSTLPAKTNKITDYFVGVPAPAGAGLALLPLILFLETRISLFFHPVFISVILLVVAFLMVSRLPTFSFKKKKVQKPYVIPLLLLVVLLAIFLVHEPWLTLSIVGLLYLFSIPVVVYQARRSL